MSVEVRGPSDATRRTSVYVEGFAHANPIPAACRIDNIIYSSIVHGIDRSASGGAGSLEDQAELMFTRVRDIVVAAGGSIDDVIKLTVWMTNRSDRERVNRFWLEMFPNAESRPARQTLNVQLDGDQLIQCDFVAVIQNREGEERS